MLYNQKSTQLSLLAFIFVLFAQLACNLPSSDDQSGTVEALAESISGTATAGASGDLGSGDSLETVEARATAEVRSAEETKTAAASLGDDALSATATAIAPILRELPKYDIDPDQGRVAWIYPPTTLEVEEYMSTDFGVGIKPPRFLDKADPRYMESTDVLAFPGCYLALEPQKLFSGL